MRAANLFIISPRMNGAPASFVVSSLTSASQMSGPLTAIPLTRSSSYSRIPILKFRGQLAPLWEILLSTV